MLLSNIPENIPKKGAISLITLIISG